MLLTALVDGSSTLPVADLFWQQVSSRAASCFQLRMMCAAHDVAPQV